MVEHLLILDKPLEWSMKMPNVRMISTETYLTDESYARIPKARVLNLSSDYSYLSSGYYCSLLAEARRHRVMPTVKSLQDLSRRSLYQNLLVDITPEICKTLDQPDLAEFFIESYFGQTTNKAFADIVRQIYSRLPFPALGIEFKRKGKLLVLTKLKPLDIKKLNKEQALLLWEGLRGHLARRWQAARPKPQEVYDLAILVDPDEILPPSDPRAIRNFITAAKRVGIDAEVIGKKDLQRLTEYDALFIRETTSIDHYTYSFARKAQTEGMVVIDDPDTILRCTNKVYLAELLKVNRISIPQTTILTRRNMSRLLPNLLLPLVMKIPDGSFSRGVKKATTLEEAKSMAREMLEESDLILAQEFVYTEFDWRIGILDRRLLYACNYFMSKSHWQVINPAKTGEWGDLTTLPVDQVPPKVAAAALKAANLIGDGLFGVDVKQLPDGRVLIIEVNDNPSIESGAEDLVLKEKLYDSIMQSFRRRLDAIMQKKNGNGL